MPAGSAVAFTAAGTGIDSVATAAGCTALGVAGPVLAVRLSANLTIRAWQRKPARLHNGSAGR